jgi:alkylation response protein AidB-like acyl-CoA dehydrogenase
MTTASGQAAGWLGPLLPAVAGPTEPDADRLRHFEHTLTGLLVARRPGPGLPQPERARRLAGTRRALAASGQLALAVPARDGGAGLPPVLQALLQFTCGYHDADLRDATGLGHGRLIARHAAAPVRDRWLPALLAGDLAGLAMTEAHGGSQLHATATAAVAHRDGSWRLSGTKTWISRLDEAAVFTVLFRDPGGSLTAGVIAADSPGLTRCVLRPAGLTGWTWGEQHMTDVRVERHQILGTPGSGLDLIREHLAWYRPLVGATALGTAAAVCDHITSLLHARRDAGIITRLRDSALITLGQSRARITAALLLAIAAHQLAGTGDGLAHARSCAAKAHAVDVAHAAAAEVTLLAGASGFQDASQLQKALGDLAAFRYADGIHDELYRAAGRASITPSTGPVALPAQMPQVHNRVHA